MSSPLTGRLDLSVWRNDDVCEIPIRIVGPNLTGLALRAQVRLDRDVPGAALIALELVTSGNAQGVRLASATQADGVWTNDVRLRFNRSTRQAMPYFGEQGSDAVLRWGLQIAGITRLTGDFRVLAHEIDSDAAPLNRPAGYGFGESSRGAASGGATLTISADGAVVVNIDGGDLIGRQVAEAQGFAAEAGRHLRAFPNYYVGLSGGTAPSIAFDSIGANDIDPGVRALYVTGRRRGQMIEDPTFTDADVTATPRFVAKPRNGRFFRRDENFINLRDVGLQYADRDSAAFADAAANNAGAWKEALTYLRKFGVDNSTLYRGTPRLKLPAERFPMARINLKQTAIIEGDGVGQEGGYGTVMDFTADGGLTVDRADTEHGAVAPATMGGDGSMLLNFAMLGGAAPAGPDANKGLLLKARAQVRDLVVSSFAGIGIHSFANATANNNSRGNANLAGMQCVTADGNWHGIKLEYGDSNAGLLLACNANNNASCGIWDASFLGNTHVGHHSSGNGISVDGRFVMVSRGGLRYVLAFGASPEQGAQIPPGTNPNIWRAFEAGGPIGQGLPEWYQGIPVKFGAAYVSNFSGSDRNCRSLWLGCYTEGTQAPAQIQWPSLAIGGFLNNVGDGEWISGEQRALNARIIRAGAAFMDGEIGSFGTNGINVPNFALLPDPAGFIRVMFGYNDGFEPLRIHGPGTNSPFGPNAIEIRRRLAFQLDALPNFANDAAAAQGGVPIGVAYRNGSQVMVRTA